ncbi:MAG: hypothetical protein G01um10145_38 [Microgenomates group bacterium Gr01-1014_5]|nr:MAG: hypothetical protein G01um10145_38 [Microgenomates group bacterium Gr01-1014_5]
MSPRFDREPRSLVLEGHENVGYLARRSHRREQRPQLNIRETWSDKLIQFLDDRAHSERPLKIGTFVIPGPEVVRLLDACEKPSREQIEEDVATNHKRRPDKNPYAWWLGGKLRDLPCCNKLEKRSAVPDIADQLLAIALHPKRKDTPSEWYSQPAPPAEILSAKTLDEVMTNIILSEPDSVTAQLIDPIELSITGLVVKTKTTDIQNQVNYGGVVPEQLLDTLQSLKHEESEVILKEWVIRQCRTENGARDALGFLKVLINFTSFLDSQTHLDLYKPPVVQGRDKEFIFNTFFSLRRCIRDIALKLHSAYKNTDIRDGFIELAATLELRYGEVYSEAHQTSIFTAREEALIPKPGDFATLAARLVRERGDIYRTSKGLVKMAESIGIGDVGPLVAKLKDYPELQDAFIEEAKACGLIADAEATRKLYDRFSEEKWLDAGEQDYAKILTPETYRMQVDVLTGTLGPCTRGHRDLIEIRLEHMKTLPQCDEQGRPIYRMILIVPMLDASGIPNYPKIPSRVGRIDERVSSICFELTAGRIDKTKVMVTTLLQPDPMIPLSLEDRVEETINVLRSKVVTDLRKAQRRAVVQISHTYLFGPDGIKWDAKTGKLAPRAQQPRRVKEDGGIAVVRRGHLERALKNLGHLQAETGLENIILTPGTPFSSSTAAINELHSTGSSSHVSPGWHFYFKKHWSLEAERARRDLPPPQHYFSVNQIYQNSLEEMRRHLHTIAA